MRFLLVAALAFGVVGCKKTVESVGSLPFSDDFERKELGPNWYPSGGQWMIENGYAYSTGANNAPCFLKVALPPDLVLEVDVHSETRTVDSKIELMTDGKTHQSGYIFILGGWSNKLSVIARLDEHGDDRKQKGPTNVVGNRTYRWRIEKKGGDIRWYMDGDLYMTYSDPNPLSGPGHDRFALSNWQNRIRWDNVKIWPYDDAPPIDTSTTAR